MKPCGNGSCLLVYIEDVHLTNFDEFQDNSAAETLRDLIEYKRWFSTRKRSVRKVESVNLISCLNIKYAEKNEVSKRLLRHFSVIGLEIYNQDSCFQIINRMLEIHSN